LVYVATVVVSRTDIRELQNSLAFIDVLIHKAANPGRREYLLLMRQPLKIKMYKEGRHQRPHIHIDYGKKHHVASYAIDTGERLSGTLDRRYDKAIYDWLGRRQAELLKIWVTTQVGGNPEMLIGQLQGDDWAI
jgi:hypothetical protein